MLTTLSAQGTEGDGVHVVIPSCSGSHAPDPETLGKIKPATLVSQPECERILADFTTRYVGVAHGIVKAELEVKNDIQRILVHVTDWNGVVNIPTIFQGMTVVMTQYVPPGAVWQL